MSIIKSLGLPTAAALALLSVHAVALGGCSSDALVGGLGFVEVSWTIKGQKATAAHCKAEGAEKVTIQWGDNSLESYDCNAGLIRRSVGEGTTLELTLALLAPGGGEMDRRKGTAVIKDDETSYINADFFGAAQPDAGIDAGSDAGVSKEAGPDSATTDTGAPDATTPDAMTPDATAPDATTPDATAPDATPLDSTSQE